MALGRLFHARVQHAQQGRDADATADQHRRCIAAVDIEMTGWSTHLQPATHLDMVVKVIGR